MGDHHGNRRQHRSSRAVEQGQDDRLLQSKRMKMLVKVNLAKDVLSKMR
jgi:hypothetical protein